MLQTSSTGLSTGWLVAVEIVVFVSMGISDGWVGSEVLEGWAGTGLEMGEGKDVNASVDICVGGGDEQAPRNARTIRGKKRYLKFGFLILKYPSPRWGKSPSKVIDFCGLKIFR